MTNRIIRADEVIASPRGRKPELDMGLVNTFKKLKDNQAIRLDDSFGEVPLRNHSTVASKIRRHWAAAREDKVSVIFTPEGIPQVKVRKPKADRTIVL